VGRTKSSVDAGATVQYTKDEAQGLVAALQKELTDSSVKLSEKQLDCMKPYIDAIFKELFPGQKSEGEGIRNSLESLHTALAATMRTSSEGSLQRSCNVQRIDRRSRRRVGRN